MYSLENREQSLFRDDICGCFVDFSVTGGRLKRWRLFRLMGCVIGTVWFTSLCSTSHTARVQVSPSAALCLPLLCVYPQHLSCSGQDDHCCIQRTGSPSLPWLGLVIAHLLQISSMHVSSVHGDVHLCPASCRLIHRIPELNEPSRDQILSSH